MIIPALRVGLRSGSYGRCCYTENTDLKFCRPACTLGPIPLGSAKASSAPINSEKAGIDATNVEPHGSVKESDQPAPESAASNSPVLEMLQDIACSVLSQRDRAALINANNSFTNVFVNFLMYNSFQTCCGMNHAPDKIRFPTVRHSQRHADI